MVVSSSHVAVVPPVIVLLFSVRAEPTKYSLELEETDLSKYFALVWSMVGLHGWRRPEADMEGVVVLEDV